ncbi:MAG: hypothetical protein M1829_004336 [Trizodia sp. TS-e1964]|nr:MAG: hypothetical protein M1829_004336 [Trizodia sp. TS-e1964]
MAVGVLLFIFIAIVKALPRIAFPLNAQVPPIARVSQAFAFTFSASTFYSDWATLTYSLRSAPSWLQLDTASRTLFGTPTPADVGVAIIQLTATDGGGSSDMNATLIVSSSPGPMIHNGLSNQITLIGPSSQPSTLLYYPSESFDFSFASDTFGGGNNLSEYYAVSFDNTPLPSWIRFDPKARRVYGSTPSITSLISLPQTFSFNFIASDIIGFAGAIIPFNLVVSPHKLFFDIGSQTLNVTRNITLTSTNLRSHLVLDGSIAQSQDLIAISAQIPSWLTFDNSSGAITGTPDQQAQSTNITISAQDRYGNIANSTIYLQLKENVTPPAYDANATVGETFFYPLNQSQFTDSHAVIRIDTNPEASWLSFDTEKFAITGNVPNDTALTEIRVTVKEIAGIGSEEASEPSILYIHIQDSKTPTASLPTSKESTTTPTNTSSATDTVVGASQATGAGKTLIVLAIVVPIVLLLVVFIFLFLFIRRRRAREYRKPLSPPQRNISRPILDGNGPWPTPPEDDEDGDPRTFGKRSGRISSTNFARLRQPHMEVIIDEEYDSENSITAGEFTRLPPDDLIDSPIKNFSLKTPSRVSGGVFSANDWSPKKPSSRRVSRQSAASVGLPVNRRMSGIGHGSGCPESLAQPAVKPALVVPILRSSWTTASDGSGGEGGTEILLYEASNPKPEALRLVPPPRNPARLSVAAVKPIVSPARRGLSPFFGAGSSRGSSRVRAWQKQEILRGPSPTPVAEYMDNTIDNLLRDYSSNRITLMPEFPPPVAANYLHIDTLQNTSEPHANALSGPSSSANKPSPKQSCFAPASVSPVSRTSEEYVYVRGLWKGHDQHGRKISHASSFVGRDSNGNLLEYGKDEDVQESVGIAVKKAWEPRDLERHSGGSPLSFISNGRGGTQLRLVEYKDKRPVSMEENEHFRRGRSQSAEFSAFV